MTVTVVDVNDNSPMFLASSYSGSVVENSNVGSTVLAVEASDLDEVSNPEIPNVTLPVMS